MRKPCLILLSACVALCSARCCSAQPGFTAGPIDMTMLEADFVARFGCATWPGKASPQLVLNGFSPIPLSDQVFAVRFLHGLFEPPRMRPGSGVFVFQLPFTVAPVGAPDPYPGGGDERGTLLITVYSSSSAAQDGLCEYVAGLRQAPPSPAPLIPYGFALQGCGDVGFYDGRDRSGNPLSFNFVRANVCVTFVRLTDTAKPHPGPSIDALAFARRLDAALLAADARNRAAPPPPAGPQPTITLHAFHGLYTPDGPALTQVPRADSEGWMGIGTPKHEMLWKVTDPRPADPARGAVVAEKFVHTGASDFNAPDPTTPGVHSRQVGVIPQALARDTVVTDPAQRPPLRVALLRVYADGAFEVIRTALPYEGVPATPPAGQ